MSDKHDPYRRDPPKEDEWHHIWQAIDKAHKGWVVTGPIYAAVTNWKAWLAITAFIVWMNRPEIIAALSVLIGGS